MPTDPRDRVIVALDVDTLEAALLLVDRLDGIVTRFKIGSQLFTAAGPSAVEAVRKRGGEVFLDLKYHDIPNTVAGAAREATRLGVFMFNVHASGGLAMMRAAADGTASAAKASASRRPLVIAVTVLTSLDRAALSRELGVSSSVEGHVLHLCQLAREAGLDGCVAAAHEIRAIRTNLVHHHREWLTIRGSPSTTALSRSDARRASQVPRSTSRYAPRRLACCSASGMPRPISSYQDFLNGSMPACFQSDSSS